MEKGIIPKTACGGGQCNVKFFQISKIVLKKFIFGFSPAINYIYVSNRFKNQKPVIGGNTENL
jgi:hypothetical protein